MSFQPHQITGNLDSFNNNNSFNNNISSNNNNSFNTINQFTDTEVEGRQIIRWLSPLEPQKRHHDIRSHRLHGVGNGVLEAAEFRKWHDAQDGCLAPVLFCSGYPGVGKTYIR